MKLLIVDVSSLFQAVNRIWPGRRLDYQKIKDMVNADICVAVGSHLQREHGGFMRALRMIGYIPIYDKVEKLETARASVQIAMKVVQSAYTHLILGSDDPLVVPLLQDQRSRMIPVELLSVAPLKSMVDCTSKVTMITDEWLMPLSDDIDQIIADRELEQPRGEKVRPGDTPKES